MSSCLNVNNFADCLMMTSCLNVIISPFSITILSPSQPQSPSSRPSGVHLLSYVFVHCHVFSYVFICCHQRVWCDGGGGVLVLMVCTTEHACTGGVCRPPHPGLCKQPPTGVWKRTHTPHCATILLTTDVFYLCDVVFCPFFVMCTLVHYILWACSHLPVAFRLDHADTSCGPCNNNQHKPQTTTGHGSHGCTAWVNMGQWSYTPGRLQHHYFVVVFLYTTWASV